jgi:hypothetical protein
VKASAAKRGRNPAFPYIPVVVRGDGSTHNTNTRNAYASREEAIACAQRWIDRSLELDAKQVAARVARWATR